MTERQNLSGYHYAYVYVPAHAAAAATEVFPLMIMPFDAKIEHVRFMPQTAITGQDTNTTHINIHDRGAAGTGTTELGNVDYVDGTDATALLGTTIDTADAEMDAGDILGLQFEKVGNGLAIPEGLAEIKFLRN